MKSSCQCQLKNHLRDQEQTSCLGPPSLVLWVTYPGFFKQTIHMLTSIAMIFILNKPSPQRPKPINNLLLNGLCHPKPPHSVVYTTQTPPTQWPMPPNNPNPNGLYHPKTPSAQWPMPTSNPFPQWSIPPNNLYTQRPMPPNNLYLNGLCHPQTPQLKGLRHPRTPQLNGLCHTNPLFHEFRSMWCRRLWKGAKYRTFVG